ncbi:MAG: HEAT repeat domain-containing protein [bacterium]|nr:HEAT repeat domain-containing protein [bacterium]
MKKQKTSNRSLAALSGVHHNARQGAPVAHRALHPIRNIQFNIVVTLTLLAVLILAGCGEHKAGNTEENQKKELATILSDWEKNGGKLENPGNCPAKTIGDATALVSSLQHVAIKATRTPSDDSDSLLYVLTGFFRDVESQEAFTELYHNGLPRLLKIYDEAKNNPVVYEKEILLMLKIFAMYVYPEGNARIISAAHKGFGAENTMWSEIFTQFQGEHPHSVQLCDRLRKQLPPGFIAVAYLDFSNKLAVDGKIEKHPFDNIEGRKKLGDWLNEITPEKLNYPHSVAASLPFISQPERNFLLQKAKEHPNIPVRMEAALAMARLGKKEGIDFLKKMCLDPRTGKRASFYLEELGYKDLIPAKASEKEFKAMAEMCTWLAHPMEFGRSPDKIELYDSRKLFWPPTSDKRQVWLFKYTYNPIAQGKEPIVGIGMAGTVTYSLKATPTATLPPEDIYGLHCCHELKNKKDKRAPEKISAQFGKEMLERYKKKD